MRVVIVDDNEVNRLRAASLIEQSIYRPEGVYVHEIEKYPESGIAPICIELMRLDGGGRKEPGVFHGIDVVVLDLNLGQSAWDGFKIVRAVQHCRPGWRFVINSSQHEDQATRVEAKQLGIRFGNAKNSNDLPSLVIAAAEVASVRAETAGLAMQCLQRPITPCEGDLNCYHVELLQAALRFGLNYTGAKEDVDQSLLSEICALGTVCHQKAEEEHFWIAERRRACPEDEDGGYFEGSYTVLSFLAHLRERVEASLAKTDRLVTYR